MRVWQNCPDCDGEGGYMRNGEWVPCSGCDGDEGWMVDDGEAPTGQAEP